MQRAWSKCSWCSCSAGLFVATLLALPAAAQSVQVTVSAQPPAAVIPAPPPAAPAPAPVVTAPVVTARPVPEGQWVMTGQYGWVYMPYAQAYTYVPPAGSPSMYVFYPAFGWRWVTAPWVVGVGPVPSWGPHGYVRFAWYARPWFARPVVVRRGRHHGWVRY